MRHAVILLALLLTAAPAAAEEPPRVGLMWKRTDLPATLPLQVQAPPGQDHVVFLHPADGGDAIMAGYVQGGAFFRLLVPPGEWRIRLASGTDWQGDEALFGPKTEWQELPEPLRFAAGSSRLNGHILRLDDSNIQAAPQAICRLPSWHRGVFDEDDPVGRQPREPQPLEPRETQSQQPREPKQLELRAPQSPHPRKLQPLRPPEPPPAQTQPRPRYAEPSRPNIHQPPLSYPDRRLRLRSVICD
ncbi:hypothetical protein [Paracoccus xiamenensis]|uniref:hypothetical protein n=1 Tax=Paracoccus xiamenensis TaxID=2714901 RepID=UPI001408BDE9|nr:hypothetical protein [Paracoccus xiamenensis]NHF72795.1 hypothetical protein [Paracoccus xiamenensis]